MRGALIEYRNRDVLDDPFFFSRFSLNEGTKSEQTMDIDDVDIDAKLTTPSMNALRNQFNDIVRISDRKADSSRKRQPSAQVFFSISLTFFRCPKSNVMLHFFFVVTV
jgi:hypothetical protein